jgi:hypothetical protein
VLVQRGGEVNLVIVGEAAMWQARVSAGISCNATARVGFDSAIMCTYS